MRAGYTRDEGEASPLGTRDEGDASPLAAWRLAISASLTALAADSSCSTADSRRRAGAPSPVEADVEAAADVDPASGARPPRPASESFSSMDSGLVASWAAWGGTGAAPPGAARLPRAACHRPRTADRAVAATRLASAAAARAAACASGSILRGVGPVASKASEPRG